MVHQNFQDAIIQRPMIPCGGARAAVVRVWSAGRLSSDDETDKRMQMDLFQPAAGS